MQALAFLVRMLLIFWFALFVSSLRCLSGGASLIETLMISVPLSFLIDAAFGCRVGTPYYFASLGCRLAQELSLVSLDSQAW